MNRSNFSHLVFVWLHPALAFFMLTTTVGMVMMYISINDGTTVDSHFIDMTARGSFIQNIILILMRIEHKGIRYSLEKPTRVIYLLFRICIASAHATLSSKDMSYQDIMMVHALLNLTVNFLDIGLHIIKDEDHRQLHNDSILLKRVSKIDVLHAMADEAHLNNDKRMPMSVSEKNIEMSDQVENNYH